MRSDASKVSCGLRPMSDLQEPGATVRTADPRSCRPEEDLASGAWEARGPAHRMPEQTQADHIHRPVRRTEEHMPAEEDIRLPEEHLRKPAMHMHANRYTTDR